MKLAPAAARAARQELPWSPAGGGAVGILGIAAIGGGTVGMTGIAATRGGGFADWVGCGGGTDTVVLGCGAGVSACAGGPEFKSAGRNFGKGGIMRGTKAGFGGVIGKAVGASISGAGGFDRVTGSAAGGSTTGAASFALGLAGRICLVLVFDLACLHLFDGNFEQSCPSMPFKFCSMPCNKVLACAGLAIAPLQAKAIKPAKTIPNLMKKLSHISQVKGNINLGIVILRLLHRYNKNSWEAQ